MLSNKSLPKDFILIIFYFNIMAVLKFFFYLTAYLLIRLGNFVEFIFKSSLSKALKFFNYIVRILSRIRTYSFSVELPDLPKVRLPKIKWSNFSFKIKHAKKINQKKERKEKKKIEEKTYNYTFFSKLKYFLIGIVFSLFFILIPLIIYVFISDLPTLDKLSVAEIPQTTKLYDRNGELLYEFYANQNRTIVNLNEIPDFLKEATIAIEDQNFYSHPGFDIRGISRAIVSNITKEDLQGGSTITQQLIKSALLTPEPTIIRKAKEVVLAVWTEQNYSKDQILELYFNYVPYGGTAWGIEAASNLYFGKDVSDINLSEAAFLAGLPRAPSIYSPFINSDDVWRKRQWEVLTAMVRDGYITEPEAYDAYRKPLVFNTPQTSIKAPHFVMYLKEKLEEKYGLYEVERGGLRVVTTLDLNIQRYVEEQVKKTVAENGYLGIGNAASVVIDPSNGDILAMVGSKDFFDEEGDGNVNLVTSLRQPGSTIKLITYAAALENGFSEGSLLQDTPVTIKIEGAESYRPVNYDGRYHGMVPLRLALANSYNIPAVRITEKIGPDVIADYGRRMGISSWSSDKPYGLSITLGGNEVTMLDLATAYGVVANDGMKVDPEPVISVKDSMGRVIYEKEVKPSQVIKRSVAFILEDILSDNKARSSAFGSNSPLNIEGRRVSVKTGTTDNKRDNWTVGFTNDYVVATWVGNNDNTPLSPTLASGITGAAPLWRNIMENLVINDNTESIVIPGDVVKKNCFGYDAYFISGTEGSSTCRAFRPSPTPALH